jgi:hypothetical protein
MEYSVLAAQQIPSAAGVDFPESSKEATRVSIGVIKSPTIVRWDVYKHGGCVNVAAQEAR